MTDPVDAAIAATDPKGTPVKVFKVSINLPSGRPATVEIPADITPIEMIGLVGFLTGGGLVEAFQTATDTPGGRLRAIGLEVPGGGR